MKTCVFTPPHEPGRLVADILPYAGSHDTRLGRESLWPQVPSGTHCFQAVKGQGGGLRPDWESGIFVAWEYGITAAVEYMTRCTAVAATFHKIMLYSQPFRHFRFIQCSFERMETHETYAERGGKTS
jgi:hypothetical protein